MAIFSHGAQGTLSLGNGELWTVETLRADSSPWIDLGGLLSGDAVIDLYGCSIAAGEDGTLFVETLSSVTGAAVRASDDATGNVEGTDWVLEVTTGRNDASSLLDYGFLEPGTIRLADLVGDDALDDDLTIAATDSYNNVYGLGGDDTITWNGGEITGTMDGGDGTDTLYLNVADGVVNITYDGTASSGTLTYDYGETTTYSIYWTGFESVYLTANGNDNTIEITQGSKVDQVDGGDGSDTLNATYSDVRIFGDGLGSVAVGTATTWGSSETLATWTGMDTVNILGTTGEDRINIDSTGAVTSIDGSGGNDFIINAGSVYMDIDGGEGEDTISNLGLVSEDICGGDGDDKIYNNDNSTVSGDIDGGLGADLISLGSQTDTPCTVGGCVYGGGDSGDTLEAEYADVTVYGDNSGVVGSGTATFSLGSHEWEGFETVTIRAPSYSSASITIDASAAVTNAEGSSYDYSDTISNRGTVSGNIDGGNGGDEIYNYQTVSGDILGGLGNDMISNRGTVSGNIDGGLGNDTITWNGGTITGTVDGDDDNDTLYLNMIDQVVNITYDGTPSSGTLTYDYGDTTTYSISWTDLESVYLTANDNDNTIDIMAGSKVDQVDGGEGSDTLNAMCTDARIYGDGSGSVSVGTITNSGGSETLATWTGMETVNILGTTGADKIIIDNSGAVTSVDGDAGDDTITNYGTVLGVIDGSGGSDSISNYGTVSRYIDGGEGRDTITNGRLVSEDIYGGGDDDTINNTENGTVCGNIDGGEGNDFINLWSYNENSCAVGGRVYGGDGSDTLEAEYHNVTIYGDNSGVVGSGTAVFSMGRHEWEGFETVTITAPWNYYGIITIDASAAVTNVEGDSNSDLNWDTITNWGTVTGEIGGSKGWDEIYNHGMVGGDIDGGDSYDKIYNYGTVSGDIEGGRYDDEITNCGTVAGDIDGGDSSDHINNYGLVSGSIYGGGDTDFITCYGTVGKCIFGDDNDTATYGIRDTIVVKSGGTVNLSIYGEGGDDTITNEGAVNNMIYGGEGNDEITNYGTVSQDICGNEGNDHVYFFGGDVGTLVGGEDAGGGDVDTLHLNDRCTDIVVNGEDGSCELDGNSVSWIEFESSEQVSVNDAPVALSFGETGNEDEYIVVDFTGQFDDPNDNPPNNAAYITIMSVSANGTLYLDADHDGSFEATLAEGDTVSWADATDERIAFLGDSNWNGTTSFTYTVTDDGGTADGGQDTDPTPATVSITVAPVNDDPEVSGTISVTATEDDGTVLVDLLDGASDPDSSDTLSVDGLTLIHGDASGITDNGDSLTIDTSAYNSLAEGENAVIQYTYSVIDGNGGSVSQTVTITITGVNDDPEVSGPISVTATEDDGTVTVDLLDGASDPDSSDTLSVDGLTLIHGDTSGITDNGDSLTIDASAYNSLAEGENAVIQYTYSVIDGNGGSVSQTVTITITGVNDDPEVSGPISVSATEDDGTVTVDLLDGASDPDSSDTLSVDGLTLVSGDASGITDNGDSLTIDTSVYDSLAIGESEVIQFSYKVIDGNNGWVSQTVTITITGVNDAPTSANGAVTTDEDVSYTFQVTDFSFDDPDAGDTLHSVKITELPDVGRLYLNGNPVGPNGEILFDEINNGLLIFKPGQDGNGGPYGDFLFQVSDGTDFSANSYTMSISVEAVNDAPLVAAPGSVYAFADTFTTITGISVGDVDVKEGTGTVEVTLTVNHGTLKLLQADGLALWSGDDGSTYTMVFSGLITDVVNALSTLTYTPDAGYVGDDTMQMSVDDQGNFGAGGPLEVERTIDIEVIPFQDFNEPDREQGHLSSIPDGSISDTGPMTTVGLMPTIGSLLEFLHTRGLLPQSSGTGQGTDADSGAKSFPQIAPLLPQALPCEYQESQDQSWNSLLSFMSDKKAEGGEERLELEEFLARVKQWQIGKTLDDILLVFNANDVKLAEWFHSSITSYSDLLDHQSAALLKSSDLIEKPPSMKTMVFDMNELRIADLVLQDHDGQSLTGSGELFTKTAGGTVCRFFDLDDPSLL